MIFKNYNGSGIIPIIKINNKYYFVLFQSIIRKKKLENIIEDSGGKFEGNNIKISAIRELKEESSLIFNLENFQKNSEIKKLNYVLNNFNITLENPDNKKYLSCFVYLTLKNNEDFNVDNLKKEFKLNMKELWKNGFSFYTENKDIIFIPIENILDLNKNSDEIKDYNQTKYYLFVRTLNIFLNLIKNNNLKEFIKNITKYPIILNKNILPLVDLDLKYKLNNIITYF